MEKSQNPIDSTLQQSQQLGVRILCSIYTANFIPTSLYLCESMQPPRLD